MFVISHFYYIRMFTNSLNSKLTFELFMITKNTLLKK